MKYYSTLILVSILCFSCSESVESLDMDRIRELKDYRGTTIMSYNVENLFDTRDDPNTNDNDFLPLGSKRWTKKRFDKKIAGIASVITEIAPDFPILVGLLEIENAHCLNSLISNALLKDELFELLHRDSKDSRGMDVGLLYRTDMLWVQRTEFIPVVLDNGFHSRDILYVHFRLKGAESLHVYLNHWPSRRKGKAFSEKNRLKAAKLLRNHINILYDEVPEAKILVMGDFNDYPTDKSIVEGLYADSLKHQLDQFELLNLSYESQISKRGTYFYRGDWGMLDQMLISKSLLKEDTGLTIDKDNFGIFDAKWLMYTHRKKGITQPNRTYRGTKYYGGYSDHLPIYIKLN